MHRMHRAMPSVFYEMKAKRRKDSDVFTSQLSLFTYFGTDRMVLPARADIVYSTLSVL